MSAPPTGFISADPPSQSFGSLQSPTTVTTAAPPPCTSFCLYPPLAAPTSRLSNLNSQSGLMPCPIQQPTQAQGHSRPAPRRSPVDSNMVKALDYGVRAKRRILAVPGRKPYACEAAGCKSAFRYPSELRAHRRRHTGEKPYGCRAPRFPYRSSRAGDRNVHEHRMHPQPPDQNSI